MKRVLLMLAATAAFAGTTAMAQVAGASGAPANAGGTATSSTGSNVAAGAQSGSQTETNTGRHHKKGEKAASGKMSKLTGCLSQSADSDGMYTLSNGRYKKGVEVGPSDKLQADAGHQVELKGHWASAAAAGENTSGVAASANEKGERHFEVDSAKSISDTCKEAPGGGTMGHKSSKKHKGASGDNTGNAGSTSTPPPTI